MCYIAKQLLASVSVKVVHIDRAIHFAAYEIFNTIQLNFGE